MDFYQIGAMKVFSELGRLPSTTTPLRRQQSRSGRRPRRLRTRSPRLRVRFIPTLSAVTKMSLKFSSLKPPFCSK